MGNAQLVPRAGNNKLCITESFLQEFQKHVTLVDHAVTGLARGIDIMTLTCKRSMQRRDEETSNKPGLYMEERTESSVLNTINEQVTESKAIMIEAVRNCLNFIVQSFSDHIEDKGDSHALLGINKYNSTPKEWDCEMEFRKASFENLKREITFLMAKNENQKQEIDICKKKEEWFIQQLEKLQNQSQGFDVVNVGTPKESENEDKCCTHRKNINVDTDVTAKVQYTQEGNKTVNTCSGSSKKLLSVEINEKNAVKDGSIDASSYSPDLDPSKLTHIREFDDESTHIRKEMCEQDKRLDFYQELEKAITLLENKHKEEIKEKQIEIDSLSIQLNILKSKKIVRVQLYHPLTFGAPTVEKEIMDTLRSKLQLQGIELATERCMPQTVQTDIPLLICWEKISSSSVLNSFKKTNTVKTAIKEFEGFDTRLMAVVIFYRKSEREMLKEVQKNDGEDQDLGGIFRVGHSNCMHTSSINDNAVEGIVEFIKNTGKITKKFETEL